MKILIDPMLAVFAKDLSTEDKAELLMCILEYPNRDCDLGLWKYTRQQIDLDAKKYREKCERMAEVGKNRWKNTKTESKSYPKSEAKSETSSDVSKEESSKENCNCNEIVSSNAAGVVKNSVDKFFISVDFSFERICKEIPKLSNYLSTYLPAVVERAQKTLIKKRQGQWLSLSEILEWLQQESVFYKQNHGGA